MFSYLVYDAQVFSVNHLQVSKCMMPGVFDFLMNRNIFSIVCRIDETNSMKTNAKKNMHISVTIRVD